MEKIFDSVNGNFVFGCPELFIEKENLKIITRKIEKLQHLKWQKHCTKTWHWIYKRCTVDWYSSRTRTHRPDGWSCPSLYVVLHLLLLAMLVSLVNQSQVAERLSWEELLSFLWCSTFPCLVRTFRLLPKWLCCCLKLFFMFFFPHILGWFSSFELIVHLSTNYKLCLATAHIRGSWKAPSASFVFCAEVEHFHKHQRGYANVEIPQSQRELASICDKSQRLASHWAFEERQERSLGHIFHQSTCYYTYFGPLAFCKA